MEEVRAALEAGRPQEAWALYQIYCTTASTVLPEMHYLGGRAAEGCGNYHDGQRCMERAIQGGATGILLAKARLSWGELLRRTGNIVHAAETLEGFLAESDDFPGMGLLMRAYGRHNLALTYRQLGRMQLARDTYLGAAEDCRAEGLQDMLGRTLWNLAWVLCLLGDTAGASAALKESESVRSDEWGRWHQLVGWAFVEATEGWQHSTTDRCKRIMSSQSAPPDVVAQAHILVGREALRLGELTEAMAMADRAIDVVVDDPGENRTMRDAIDFRQSVLRAMKSKEEAAGA